MTLRFTASPNTIADSLVIDTPDFVIDDDGTRLGAGNQFVRPVNLAGYWNLRTTLNYGFPVRFLRSNLNLRAGVTTGRIPSIINGTRNLQAGCKLFRQRLGEVTVGVNDLFDRGGTSFRRTVTGTYIRNVTNLGLGRYFLMQFTYNLRLFPRQGAAVTRLLEEGE